MPHRTFITAAVFILATLSIAHAADTEMLAAGKALVTENCAACHAVDITDASAHAEAPAFRTLSARYPVQQLEEALAEGIMSGHPDMPEFAFEVDDVERIIAWLERIQD